MPGIGPVVPPLPPSPVPAAIAEAVERIQRHLLVLQALQYIRCRQEGGSLEKCLFGRYRVTPPKPDDPFAQELFQHAHPSDAKGILLAIKEDLEAQAAAVKRELAELEKQG